MKLRYALLATMVAATLGAMAQGSLSATSQAVLMGREQGLKIEPGRPTELVPAAMAAPALDAAPEMVTAFIELYEDADYNVTLALLEQLGVEIRSTTDEILTASLPVANLRQVAECVGVKFVQVGHKGELKLAQGRKDIGADKVRNNTGKKLPQGYTGSGVVVGIIDTGLEFNHVDFRKPDGSLRLKRVWNQSGLGRAPANYGYGTEYKTEQEIRAASYDSGMDYHASHVTGIAAGSDMTLGYNGVAPEADLVFVSFGNEDTNITDAVKYIFEYADEVGMPCVVNMSLGQHIGPHDGTSYLDRTFEKLVGPGRILVGACGNEGQTLLHAHKAFTEGDNVLKTMLAYPSPTARKAVHADIWGSVGSQFEVSVGVVDALKGRIVEQTEWISSNGGSLVKGFSQDVCGADATFQITSTTNNSNGRPNMYIVSGVTSISDSRKMAIFVRGNAGDEVHMWNVGGYDFSAGSLRGWTAGDNDYTCGEIGGTGKGVISVGSYDSADNFPVYWDPMNEYVLGEDQVGYQIQSGYLSPFSSRGPTADGRMKPEVLAPGALITSAVSKHYAYWSDQSMYATLRSKDSADEYYYYGLNLGTSMSAPFVTGTIALWLQANPSLSPDDIRNVLRHTSRRDSKVGSVAGNDIGYGKLDAFNGMLDVLGKSDVGAVAVDEAPIGVLFDKAMETLNCVSPADGMVTVVSANGRVITTQAIKQGNNTIATDSWASGIYIVTVSTDSQARSYKIAK